VRHFLGRGFLGKAMVVSIDKATALRMHDKVRKYWDLEIARVRDQLGPQRYGSADIDPELDRRLQILTTTDMALIVSPGQNEIAEMKKLGLDIEPHRRRMNEQALDEKFKDSDDPLRLVFVCAMWLTGFDAPSCSTVYLDKPMRNHTLMQTIARANRVYPGKHSGLIVDYANVFTSLEKALAIYGAGKNGRTPVKDKEQLVDELRNAITNAKAYCTSRGVELDHIEQLHAGTLERLAAVDDAINALIAPDTVRREFLTQERLVVTLHRAIKPDPAAVQFSGIVLCMRAIADSIRAKLNPNPADISAVMTDISDLLDRSITGMKIRETGPPPLDLSKIDFEALAKRFRDSRHKNTELEELKAAIKAQLARLIQINRTRVDFVEKFEELIESYNIGSRNIEELFQELVALSRGLTEEEQRHVRENMTEEELVIFDILTRPAPSLSPAERAEVKKVARALLRRLKDLMVLNWRQNTRARARLRIEIEDTLDIALPAAYSKELYNQKCAALFEQVYEQYPGAA
jgi:type I restriction enzyme, R subunit